MLKFFLKLIFIIVLIFGFSNYANYMITGETPEIIKKTSSLTELNISTINKSITNKLNSRKEKTKTEPETKTTYLYKWRDDKGVMHYTSEKPIGEIKSLESIKLSNNTNVITTNKNNEATASEKKSTQSVSTDLPTNIYSPEGIKQLFDKAKNIQNIMDENLSHQEAAIQGN